jgi:hypothetical protein
MAQACLGHFLDSCSSLRYYQFMTRKSHNQSILLGLLPQHSLVADFCA